MHTDTNIIKSLLYLISNSFLDYAIMDRAGGCSKSQKPMQMLCMCTRQIECFKGEATHSLMNDMNVWFSSLSMALLVFWS